MMCMQKRSEQEMFDEILSFAREDERVRAVWMNGSRANPNAPRDGWQDFDIVFAVTDMDSFLADDSWVDRFGERVMTQSRRDQYDAYNEEEIPDFSQEEEFKNAEKNKGFPWIFLGGGAAAALTGGFWALRNKRKKAQEFLTETQEEWQDE